jgi:geranylgeranyl diphosphate synthase type I
MPGGIAVMEVDRRAVSEIVARYSEPVAQEMAAVIDEEVDGEALHSALGYHLGWRDTDLLPLGPSSPPAGGKKVRPTLAILCYQSARASRYPGQDVPIAPVLPLAAALELLHNYSLAHDDIEDGDRCRRGRPALWSLCGMPRAINAGDCLHALAFRCLCRLRDRLDDERWGDVVASVAQSSVRLTLGQDEDLCLEADGRVTLPSYLRMIAGKTAALLRCTTYCGALVAMETSVPGREKVLSTYARFGEALGLAFQIGDDVLGIWGVEAETGKPSGSDIRRRKKSLPVVYALLRADPPARVRLRALYGDAGPATIDGGEEDFVRDVLEASGAREFAKAQAAHHSRLALEALDTLAAGTASENQYLTELRQVASYMANRMS